MNEKEERAYIQGNRAAWSRMLGECLSALRADGIPAEELKAEFAVLQLEQARAMLRIVCAEHGDNDWPDDLHLADVIEKHLARHLGWLPEEGRPGRER